MDPADIDDGEVAELAARLVAAPSPSPPGDVRAVAEVALNYLKQHSIPHSFHRPASDRMNLICRLEGSGDGPHVVLSGHLDTFPLSPIQRVNAMGGPPIERAVFGRGASDMKGGVAGFLVAARHFEEHTDDWRGRLTLCIVCDEESFGPHGIRTLLGDEGLFKADAVLSAEPSGRGMIRHGERGPVWGTVTFAGTPGHGAYSSGGQENVIVLAGRFLDALDARFSAAFSQQDSLASRTSNTSPRRHPGGDRASLNVGTISGGSKLNTRPSDCSLEIDVRIPLGLPPAAMVLWLTDLASEYGGTYLPSVVSEANASDPRGTVFTEMAAAVKVETGIQAEFEVALGSTDGRHWRRQGVPVAQYGADPLAQGTPDEHVPVTELGEIARVHTRTALALLSRKG